MSYWTGVVLKLPHQLIKDSYDMAIVAISDDMLYFKNVVYTRVKNGFMILRGSEAAKAYKDYTSKYVKKP